MPHCAAFGCNFQSKGNKGSDVSLHSFPHNKKRRKEWENACGRVQLPKDPRLCSRHFSPDAFEAFSRARLLKELTGAAGYKRRLKPNAVPTVFPHRECKHRPRIESENRAKRRQRQEMLESLLLTCELPAPTAEPVPDCNLNMRVKEETDSQPDEDVKFTVRSISVQCSPGKHDAATQTEIINKSDGELQWPALSVPNPVKTDHTYSGTQASSSVGVEVGTATTDAPWTKSQGPLACPAFKAPRPAKRPLLEIKEEDLSSEVPEPQGSTDEPAEPVTAPTESSQLPSTEVMVNTECLLELFQFCWFCQRECCTTIEGNERLFSVTQDCQSCGYHRDWRSHPSSGLSSDDQESLSEEEVKKRKRRSDSSDEWEPWLDEEATDSDSDEDLFTALQEDGEGKLVVWCTQCETEASRSCSVLRHKKLFCCAQCSAGDDVRTHNLETLPVRFDDIVSFQIHAEQEHGVQPLNILCQECGKFVRAKNEHVCEHKVKFIICPDCGKRFLSEAGLKIHYTQLHSDYDHPCKYCLKVFKTKSAKLEHEQTHPKENQPYSCPDCSERFSNILKRNSHVKSHRGPHKYVCDVCEKGFKDINRLRRHKLIHSGEKPYKCQVCERSFNQMENLTSHMRVHTGEKPFMCDQCGESFSHNVSLKNHKQRHHDSGLTREEEIMDDLEQADV